jgi:hypothetical protein
VPACRVVSSLLKGMAGGLITEKVHVFLEVSSLLKGMPHNCSTLRITVEAGSVMVRFRVQTMTALQKEL